MTDNKSTADFTPDPLDLGTVLARLQLDQYEHRLRENGFEDWEDVTTITDNDMQELGFKLGHRRKLQRAIRESSGSSGSPATNGASNPGELAELTSQSPQPMARTTRQYRRHPRADPNTPRKPKTAYVLFGEHTRQDPALSNSSFVDIAKEVGKRWRELKDEERVNVWGTPAADRLREYKEEIERYKQTEDYQSYQRYLETFKQGQHIPESLIPADSKDLPSSESKSSNQSSASRAQTELETTSPGSLDTEPMDLQEVGQFTTSPVESGMKEVRRILNTLRLNPHSIRVAAFPPEDVTTKAVEAFLQGTGSLLYLWDQDEAVDLLRSMFNPQGDLTPGYATEIFAMSSVGTYCDADSPMMMPQENFLHFFLHFLSSSSNISSLRHMRLFACLAICRFTNSVESARTLMCKPLLLSSSRYFRLTARSISP